MFCGVYSVLWVDVVGPCLSHAAVYAAAVVVVVAAVDCCCY